MLVKGILSFCGYSPSSLCSCFITALSSPALVAPPPAHNASFSTFVTSISWLSFMLFFFHQSLYHLLIETSIALNKTTI
uniref:Uncharacterized protein n=1 Tax=Anguilla anguilla TaxID=7936 RepID=A0A0E9RMP4_ANGAN